MDCLFCKIIAKEIPAAIVYEDEKTLAFLDIHPLSRGHALVIPRQHAENIFDISQDDLAAVMAAAKTVSGTIINNLQADGIKLVQSNGEAAGQVVPHFHVHLIPFYAGGTVAGNWEPQHPPRANPEELKQVAEQIRRG